jgi:DNA polymerase-1
MEVDYSQIELVVAAMLSQDPVMLSAFEPGNVDLHTLTAAAIYKIDPSEVTKPQRTSAKIVNFGILYGMGASSLAEQLGVGVEEAKGMIDSFFRKYARFKEWSKKHMIESVEMGCSKSPFGLIRRLPGLLIGDEAVIAACGRMAINFPIQCTASLMTIYSAAEIQQTFERRGWEDCAVVGQVHDSVLISAPSEKIEFCFRLAEEIMLSAVDRYNLLPPGAAAVPLRVEAKVGPNLMEQSDYPPHKE